MSAISFGQNDQELEEQIVEFQKENGIKSFSEAGRILCQEALKIKDTINNSKLLK
ncbi:MAG: hypothetical protein HDT44_10900 [Ruminococcaceae bacterium]|nr:hypothetical protein [Oscillospiraceae bacterium]